MKKLLLLAVMVALVGSGVAYANFCARDNVPAATLLVPYAVVDLNADNSINYNGYTTLLAVTNVSSDRQLIHVTVWSAMSNPVVDFDEVLSGYDVWTVNLRDVLAGRFDYFDTGTNPTGFFGGSRDPNTGTSADNSGNVCAWGPAANTKGGVAGPALNAAIDTDGKNPGVNSYDGDPINPNSSNCLYPYGNLSTLSSVIIGGLQQDIHGGLTQDAANCSVTGALDPVSPAWLTNLTTRPVFFYVTVDVVNLCSIAFPNQKTYYDPSIPASRNVLTGDIIYLNQAANFSESIPTVAIESDKVQAARLGVGNTFYGRYDTSSTTIQHDYREPLPNAYGFRYINKNGVTSEVRVWKTSQELEKNSKGQYAYYNACQPYVYYAWDEDENFKCQGGTVSGFGSPEPNVFPYETQAVPVTPANFNAVFDSGWMLIVFEQPSGTPSDQASVSVKYNFGTYSTALEAATMANAYCFRSQVLPVLGVDSHSRF
jgi:hypothetical protein